MNHTPGPWEAAGPHDVNGEPVAYIYKEGSTHALAIVRMDNGTSPEANARFIAAAPELLEACKAALRCFVADSPIKWQLKQAIAKATGGS